MSEWWSNIPAFERIFWYFAIPFTVLFSIQAILTLLGVGGGGEFDVDDGSGMGDFDGDDGGGFQDGGSFPVFTIKNFIIFFTVFGWTGIAATNSGLNNVVTVILAVLLGLIVMFIVAGIFYFMSRMTESGNISLRNAVNNYGEVYLTIPGKRSGMGKVQMKIQGSIREVDAMTDDNKISTGSTVKIIDIINDSILLVERIKD
ncbi:hypothetical protein [Sporosalibacterium faouarense]|uniref:hypothetical protein n=1 Tax=Sporosalibacterium faouarense TaxID=516123 RepID=UPI00192B18F6|nr:hypothetical protein [Sporosalibacterium faouarense]